MDNPNFVALSLVAAIIYFILRLNIVSRLTSRIGVIALILFSLFIFSTAEAGQV